MDKNFEQVLDHVNTYSRPSELKITDMRVVDIVDAPMHLSLIHI